MPYIGTFPRSWLDPTSERQAETPGELNYQLTSVCLDYLKNKTNQSYGNYNDVIGALESCKMEFYRRAVAPYEDKKIIENGDVY